MSPKQKSRTAERSSGTGIGIGIGVSLIISVILSMLLAAIISNERVGENMIAVLTPIVSLISTLTGCIVAGKQVGDKLAIVIGATGASYLLILICTGILFFDGGFHNLLTNLFVVLIACAVSCAICIRGKGSNRRRKRAYR